MRPTATATATATTTTTTTATTATTPDGFEAGLAHFAMQDEEDVDEDV